MRTFEPKEVSGEEVWKLEELYTAGCVRPDTNEWPVDHKSIRWLSGWSFFNTRQSTLYPRQQFILAGRLEGPHPPLSTADSPGRHGVGARDL